MIPRAALFLIAYALSPVATAGQVEERGMDWEGHVAIAAGNVIVGAATAGLTAWLTGGEVAEAFLKGAVGGGVVYGGKRIVAQRFPGAGLFGRQMSALGTSVISSGGRGEWLDELWLPVGPLWIDVRSGYPTDIRVNLTDVGRIAWAATKPELHIDWSRSLSNGAAVFLSNGYDIRRGGKDVNGVAMGSVVLLDPNGPDIDATQAHEAVHVIQNDLAVRAWSYPLEAHLWSRLFNRKSPFDIGIFTAVRLPLITNLNEAEAEVLEFR